MNIKKRFLQAGVLFGFILFTACGTGDNKEKTKSENRTVSEQNQDKSTSGMHEQHYSLADNFKHKNAVILEQVYQVDETTEKEMEKVIKEYLQVEKALRRGEIKAVDEAIGSMVGKVKEVKPGKLKDDGLEAWQNHKNLYIDKLKEMEHIDGIANKRSYFGHISEIMYCTIKSFGLKQGDLYAAYCPMAFDNEGAYWISDSKDIKNPYMGAKMPKCGEIKEEL